MVYEKKAVLHEYVDIIVIPRQQYERKAFDLRSLGVVEWECVWVILYYCLKTA